MGLKSWHQSVGLIHVLAYGVHGIFLVGLEGLGQGMRVLRGFRAPDVDAGPPAPVSHF